MTGIHCGSVEPGAAVVQREVEEHIQRYGVIPYAGPEFEAINSGVPCDFSEISLRMALQEFDPARLYTLSVSPREFMSACNYVRQWTNAPLALQINVVEDPALDPFAWYVTSNGRSIGSRGVM